MHPCLCSRCSLECLVSGPSLCHCPHNGLHCHGALFGPHIPPPGGCFSCSLGPVALDALCVMFPRVLCSVLCCSASCCVYACWFLLADLVVVLHTAGVAAWVSAACCMCACFAHACAHGGKGGGIGRPCSFTGCLGCASAIPWGAILQEKPSRACCVHVGSDTLRCQAVLRVPGVLCADPVWSLLLQLTASRIQGNRSQGGLHT